MINDKIKRKLKRKTINPVTSYVLLTFLVIILSGFLSLIHFQTTYNVVDSAKLEYIQLTATVDNLFSFHGLKYIVGNASKTFISFAPLSMFLIASIGLAIAEASGFIDISFKRIFSKLNNNILTFLVILVATISSLINEVGYVIIIPLAAYIFKSKKRNPMIGVCAAFAGCAFVYGTSIFVGSLETQLIPYTTMAARIIDADYHISLLSNVYIMVASTLILSIVGTVIIEKIIAPKLGKYRVKKEINPLNDFEIIGEDEFEQNVLSTDYNEKKGFKIASIVSIVFIVFFIYSVIPGLPGSGLLLDYNEDTYLKQIFGDNSYFQDGFTFLVSLLLILTSLAYGIGSKSIKNDKDLIEKSSKSFQNLGSLFILIFTVSQFIAIFRKSNIGLVITVWLANLLEHLTWSGIPLIIITLLLIAVSNFVLTSSASKWMIFSPVVVPMFMQSNISPQFAQIVMRAGDSMTKGFTPLLASFVIYIGYLNIYNLKKEKPYTIKE